MDPIKGAHRAIIAARLAGRPLVLAGPVQTGQEKYFTEHVQPHIDGHHVRYVGEIGGTPKRELLAHASALLMPIRWPEPFGMVMVEALAYGTPVIAFPAGEIVIDGHNGMLVADEAEMARAVAHLHEIDPANCRATAAERYDIAITAAGYEHKYRQAVGARLADASPCSRGSRPPHTGSPTHRSQQAMSHSFATRGVRERCETPLATEVDQSLPEPSTDVR
jgi:glycosyltransferase involved in cell wall biosynthesis